MQSLQKAHDLLVDDETFARFLAIRDRARTVKATRSTRRLTHGTSRDRAGLSRQAGRDSDGAHPAVPAFSARFIVPERSNSSAPGGRASTRESTLDMRHGQGPRHCRAPENTRVLLAPSRLCRVDFAWRGTGATRARARGRDAAPSGSVHGPGCVPGDDGV